ncbi:MAG: 4Fe-4S dicluster domain-containing protein [Hyphomicrobiales bacterium]|nr:4Fe-4S dicluster domain-containing protein [Hyphomicrobiales bacterium]
MREGETIVLKVRRQQAGDAEPSFSTYEVPYQKYMRVLDALEWLNASGADVTYRWFCSTKKCGACATKVNGVPRLMCWEAAEAENLIEPLDNFEVLRDLVVNREAYEARLRKLRPYIERTHAPPFPEPLNHVDMLGPYKLMDCIACGICTSVCPAYTGIDGEFPGPWALVVTARYARDPRDEMDRSRDLENSGVDLCMSCYRCEDVCPVEIPIVAEAIDPLREMAARGPEGKASFPRAFAQNVRENVYVHSASLYVGSRGVFEAIKSLPMALQMFSRGKTTLQTKVQRTTQRVIDALFRAAGEKEVR